MIRAGPHQPPGGLVLTMSLSTELTLMVSFRLVTGYLAAASAR